MTANTLSGDAGRDRLIGRGGADELDAGTGGARFHAGPGERLPLGLTSLAFLQPDCEDIYLNPGIDIPRLSQRSLAAPALPRQLPARDLRRRILRNKTRSASVESRSSDIGQRPSAGHRRVPSEGVVGRPCGRAPHTYRPPPRHSQTRRSRHRAAALTRQASRSSRYLPPPDGHPMDDSAKVPNWASAGAAAAASSASRPARQLASATASSVQPAGVAVRRSVPDSLRRVAVAMQCSQGAYARLLVMAPRTALEC